MRKICLIWRIFFLFQKVKENTSRMLLHKLINRNKVSFQYHMQHNWKMDSKFVVACYRLTKWLLKRLKWHELLVTAMCRKLWFRLSHKTKQDFNMHISMHLGIEQRRCGWNVLGTWYLMGRWYKLSYLASKFFRTQVWRFYDIKNRNGGEVEKTSLYVWLFVCFCFLIRLREIPGFLPFCGSWLSVPVDVGEPVWWEKSRWVKDHRTCKNHFEMILWLFLIRTK